MEKTLKKLLKSFNKRSKSDAIININNINRTKMAKILGELKFKTGAEVGVAQGNHARILCENIPDLKLYCIDVWEKYPGYHQYKNRISRYYQIAKKQLSPYDCQFIKKFSMDATDDFEDESLDFVYIDSAHDFKSVANDIFEWTKKVSTGGIVFGHDYVNSIEGKSKYPIDVKSVIQAYAHSHGIKPLLILENDLFDKNFHPESPGWLFVKQKNDRL